MADPTDFLDLPTAQSFEREAARLFSIPDSLANYFFIELSLENASESIAFPPELRTVVIKKSYFRLGGWCFRIDDIDVIDQLARYRTGTAVFRLRVKRLEVQRAIREAEALAAKLKLDAFKDFLDPTTGVVGDVADLAARIARIYRGIPVVEIFGDLADAIDLAQLADSLEKIVDGVDALRLALKRLLTLDGMVVKRFSKVRQLVSFEAVTTFSGRALTEVECAAFILALPEGEVLPVPEQDETYYPGPELKLKGRPGGHRRPAAGADGAGTDGPQPLPRKALKAIRALRRPLADAPESVPREIGRAGSASPGKAEARTRR
jgi:hypothetical protein